MKTDRCACALHQQKNECAAHGHGACGGTQTPLRVGFAAREPRCFRHAVTFATCQHTRNESEHTTRARTRYRFHSAKSSHDVRRTTVSHCDFLNWIWLIAAMFALRSRTWLVAPQRTAPGLQVDRHRAMSAPSCSAALASRQAFRYRHGRLSLSFTYGRARRLIVDPLYLHEPAPPAGESAPRGRMSPRGHFGAALRAGDLGHKC
jgi:hypothetical protein